MQIDEKIEALEKECSGQSLTGSFAIAGFICLYAALFLAAFDSHRPLAVGVTICLISITPRLLRWHRAVAARNILMDLKKSG